VDCRKETDKKLYGKIPSPLCMSCRDSYIESKPNQHFVPKSRAKSDYGLNDKELSSLNHGFCGNPMDSRWAPMNLFWKHDVEELAKICHTK